MDAMSLSFINHVVSSLGSDPAEKQRAREALAAFGDPSPIVGKMKKTPQGLLAMLLDCGLDGNIEPGLFYEYRQSVCRVLQASRTFRFEDPRRIFELGQFLRRLAAPVNVGPAGSIHLLTDPTNAGRVAPWLPQLAAHHGLLVASVALMAAPEHAGGKATLRAINRLRKHELALDG